MNLSKEQIYDFIKRPADKADKITIQTQHYLNYFDKYGAKNWFLSWNWPVFFLGPAWFVYRKMYLYAFLYFFYSAIMFLVSLILAHPLLEDLFSIGWILLTNVTAPLFANALYLRFIRKKIGERVTHCGVNKPLAILTFCLMTVLYVIGLLPKNITDPLRSLENPLREENLILSK